MLGTVLWTILGTALGTVPGTVLGTVLGTLIGTILGTIPGTALGAALGTVLETALGTVLWSAPGRLAAAGAPGPVPDASRQMPRAKRPQIPQSSKERREGENFNPVVCGGPVAPPAQAPACPGVGAPGWLVAEPVTAPGRQHLGQNPARGSPTVIEPGCLVAGPVKARGWPVAEPVTAPGRLVAETMTEPCGRVAVPVADPGWLCTELKTESCRPLAEPIPERRWLGNLAAGWRDQGVEPGQLVMGPRTKPPGGWQNRWQNLAGWRPNHRQHPAGGRTSDSTWRAGGRAKHPAPLLAAPVSHASFGSRHRTPKLSPLAGWGPLACPQRKRDAKKGLRRTHRPECVP
jgi:hypothetical protein